MALNSSCVTDTTSIKHLVVNGQLSSDLIVKPAPTLTPCASGTDNPDTNVLIKTALGVAVIAGKTGTIKLYKHCESSELRGQLVIRKMRTDTADLNGPSNYARLDETSVWNALYETDQGAQVLVGKSDSEGTIAYVDYDSKEIRFRLKVYGEKTTATGTYMLPCDKKAIRNAFRLYSEGWGVLVSGNPPVIDSFTGRSVAGLGDPEYTDGAIRVYLDCDSGMIRSDIILEPDGSISTGADGTGEGGVKGYRIGCSAMTMNALQIGPAGAKVVGGYNKGLEIFASCSDRSLLARYVFDESNQNVLTTSDDGLKLNIATKGPNGELKNGISIVEDPRHEVGSAGYGGLWVHPSFTGMGQTEYSDTFTLASPGDGSGATFNAQRILTLQTTNESGTTATCHVFFDGPSIDAEVVPGHFAKVTHDAAFGVGNYDTAAADTCGGGSTADNCTKAQHFISGTYSKEYLVLDVKPLQVVQARMQFNVVISGAASGTNKQTYVTFGRSAIRMLFIPNANRYKATS